MQRSLLYLALVFLQCLLQVLTQNVLVADENGNKLPSRCLKEAPLESRCRAAKRSFYYSPEVKDCVSFMYGGCGADDPLETLSQMNLFLDPFECEEVCKAGICPPSMCLMECPHGMEVNTKGCEICQCKIAPNEHPPLATCQQMACSDICVNGYLFDAKGCQTCACRRADTPVVATCQQMACPDICSSGFTLDTNGCQTCECNPTLVACQQMSCPNLCRNGYALDSTGCETCECKPTVAACDRMACSNACTYGYVFDSKGCQTCVCNSNPVKPTSPAPCPEIECDERCPRGYALDLDGCLTCKCIQPSSSCTTGPRCMMYCSDGFMLNQKGCPTCKCASAPVPAPLPVEKDCSLARCNLFCPAGGFRKDSKGCPVCECAEDPCETLNCCEDEICLKDVSHPPFISANCIPGRRWCSMAQCSMFCEHGFVSDVYGCMKCRCRTSPAPRCPEVPPTCSNHCTFGHAYDSNGCKTCDCLRNGCEGKDCAGVKEVCAAKVHKFCSDCPITPVCADESDVTRANVTLTYKHDTALVRHAEDIKREVSASVSSMLQIPSSQITYITSRRSSDFHTTVVSFHLSTQDQSVVPVCLRLYRHFQQDDGRQSQLVVHGLTFTPQAGTMETVYYTGDVEAWNEGYGVEEDGHSVGVIVIAILLISIVTMIIAAICVVACRRRRHRRRSSAIYKPVDTVHM